MDFHGAVALIVWVTMTHAVVGLAFAQQESSLRLSTGVRFLAPDRAELRWESNLEGPASVAFGPTRKLGTIKESPELGTSHTVVLDRLTPGEPLYYRIGVRHAGKRLLSPFYSIESGMNYSVPEIPRTSESPTGIERVIEQFDQLGGVAIVVDPFAEAWASPIAQRSQMTVIASCLDRQSLHSLRTKWYDDGVYGIRLSAQLAVDLPDGIANLVVTDAAQLPRVMPWLSPAGILVCLSDSEPSKDLAASKSIHWSSVDTGVWIGRQSGLESLAGWGHQYGSTANGSYAGETLGGADEAGELTVRWLGRPGGRFRDRSQSPHASTIGHRWSSVPPRDEQNDGA